jgi:putative transposase
MSISFSQGKLQADERKSIIQVVQKQAKAAALNAIRPVLMGFLEAEVTSKLGRAKGESRQVSSAQRSIDWQCARCGCSDANQFTRDGHYRRNLETGWGHLEDLQVPMLECQQCQHDVICSFTILEKYRRFWLDLDQEVLFSSGLCQSLREISQRWSAIVGGSVGLRTINERINQIEPLLLQAHHDPITDVPTVVQLDGIWLTIQSQTEKEKPDRRKRRRKERKGKRVVVLVALGFWNDGSGRREIIDWEIAKSEEHTEWEKLLNRLWERGVRPEQGLQMVVRDGSGGLGEALAFVYGSTVLEQRCLFHKLRNVADKARSELKGEEKREERQQVLEQASAIYQAESAAQARERLTRWAEDWRERAPKAVATLQRDFEQTLVYYSLESVAREWIRTTSLLERTNRHLRRKFRQAVTFGSRKGAEVAIYLQVQRLHAQWMDEPWWETSHALFFALWNLNP